MTQADNFWLGLTVRSLSSSMAGYEVSQSEALTRVVGNQWGEETASRGDKQSIARICAELPGVSLQHLLPRMAPFRGALRKAIALY